MRFRHWSIVVAAMAATISRAESPAVDPALPAYVPMPRASVDPGTPITIVGYNDMRELLEPLAARYAATHDGLPVVLELPGTRFAPQALASGRSALAPMGAELTPPQAAAYRAEAGHDPIAFRVAHASLDPRALSGPLAIFVHADNPVVSLSIAQLASIYSGGATTWADLGLSGTWAGRPIHPRGLRPGTALAADLQRAVLDGAPFTDALIGVSQSAEVVRDVGADPLAIGFAAAMRIQPGARMVPISRGGEPATLPTVETIREGRYPLDRHLLVYARRPLSPFARDFVGLLLSSEGQAAVAATPQHYVPLSAAEAEVERAKLERP